MNPEHQESHNVNYELIKKTYNHTIIGDILYPIILLDDNDYTNEILNKLCKYKEELINGVLL